MACGSSSSFQAFLDMATSGRFFDFLLCPGTMLLGTGLFVLMILLPVALGIRISSGSMMIPMVLTIILAGFIFVLVPSIVVKVAAIAVILGLTVAGWLMVNRTRGPV